MGSKGSDNSGSTGGFFDHLSSDPLMTDASAALTGGGDLEKIRLLADTLTQYNRDIVAYSSLVESLNTLGDLRKVLLKGSPLKSETRVFGYTGEIDHMVIRVDFRRRNQWPFPFVTP